MNLFMVAFRLVYEIFVLNMPLSGVYYLQLCLPFITMYTNVTWYPSENDTIIIFAKIYFD